jgi:hypothetical protein
MKIKRLLLSKYFGLKYQTQNSAFSRFIYFIKDDLKWQVNEIKTTSCTRYARLPVDHKI